MTRPYTAGMDKEDHIQRHLDLCKRVYLRMLEDGSWPWRESPDSGDVIESGDKPHDL